MQGKTSEYSKRKRSKASRRAENPSDFLAFAIKLAKESGQILLRMQKRAKIVTYKEKGDFALDADITSEKHIMKRIQKKYPEHAILTEETGKHEKKSDYMWVIDPLEGTLNYAHKVPFWAVNIALCYKGKSIVSVIYAPLFKELFHAEKGKGTYLNGKRVRVNKDTNLMKTYLTLNLKHFCEVPLSRHVMRYFGCAGLELAYVACGRLGARIKARGTDPFGYAAGSILVKEAGGKVTDMKGRPWTLQSDGVLASNGKLHNKLLKIFQ